MAQPEHKLQCAVRDYLQIALPPTIIWTASAAGVTLGSTKEARIRQGGKSKAAGVQRGWPDLQFLFPDGVTRYIELKTMTGSLSPEQRDFRNRAEPAGIWALCRSVDEVAAQLLVWGVKLRNNDFALLNARAA